MDVRTAWKRKCIYGIPLPLYLGLCALSFAAMHLDFLPSNMVGALIVLVLLGGLFHSLGEALPIVRSWLGGGTVMCIFGAAALYRLHLIPESSAVAISDFLNTAGFLDFFIAVLIAGSILSMDRKLLIGSALKFLPVAFCSMLFALAAVAAAGKLMGYTLEDSVMYTAIPMMSGGMGAGVIPLADIYTQGFQAGHAEVISRLIPASAVGNVAAILMAGLLGRLGEKVPRLSGGGSLVREKNLTPDQSRKETGRTADVRGLVTGLVAALGFSLGGYCLHHLVPGVHTYAWLILLTAAARGFGLISEQASKGAYELSRVVLTCFTHAVMIGIGIALIDLDAVAKVLTPSWLLLVIVITAAVTAGAAFGGWLVGFWPIESAITAGLCTINMGGTGNIAILSASKRMELLPFAQLATRICGSMTLVAASFLVRFFN